MIVPTPGAPLRYRGCSSVVEHLLAKERVESSNLFIRFFFIDYQFLFYFFFDL